MKGREGIILLYSAFLYLSLHTYTHRHSNLPCDVRRREMSVTNRTLDAWTRAALLSVCLCPLSLSLFPALLFFLHLLVSFSCRSRLFDMSRSIKSRAHRNRLSKLTAPIKRIIFTTNLWHTVHQSNRCIDSDRERAVNSFSNFILVKLSFYRHIDSDFFRNEKVTIDCTYSIQYLRCT